MHLWVVRIGELAQDAAFAIQRGDDLLSLGHSTLERNQQVTIN
jgi:hypothetical protein